MKKGTILLKSFLIILVVIFTTATSKAQFDELGDVIKAGKEDANILLGEYLTPIGKAWTYDLGGGWYNTASTHKTLGFDLTFSTSFAKTPDEDLLFDLAELGLNKISSATGSTEFPTITNGEDVNSITIEEEFSVTQGGNTISETVTILPATELKGFDVPVGMPMPTLNLGIGLVKNTELVGRFIPNTKLGDFGELGLWGIGVKHDFLQWLPIVDKVPVLQGSVFLGYTSMSGNFGIEYTPPQVDDMNGYVNPENQELQTSTSSLHAAILIGAKLPVVHPYVSFGVTTGDFTLDLLGEYALPKARQDPNNPTQIQTYLDPNDPDYTLQDPLSISVSNGMKPSVAAGLRIKLTVLTIYAQYAIQEYPMVTGGLGISFR
jgi:hypothetical protein